MKNVAFAILIMCVSVRAAAQKVFFIYLQSETRAPFYVRLADRVFSSSTSGYLILPNLKDSVYTFFVGYPGAQVSESRFTIPVEANDKGFLIKNFENGPGLFDLQTLVVHKPVTAAIQQEQMTTRTDSFTRRLAKAANDESLLTIPVAKTEVAKPKEIQKEPTVDIIKSEPKQEQKIEEEKRSDTAAITVIKTDPVKEIQAPVEATPNAVVIQMQPETKVQDTVVILQPEPVKVEVQPETTVMQPATQQPFKRSVVTRRSESSTTEGFGLVYIDVQETATDTIRLLIPNPKKGVTLQETPLVAEPVKQIISDVQTKDPTREITIAPEKPGNNCNQIASEKDFFKLRKQMAAENNDEEMIAQAKKYFRAKCFTTQQIRNLSLLFLTNAAKYQFFDAAYLYVSDIAVFPSLSAEIKDDYYSKRFKALIGE